MDLASYRILGTAGEWTVEHDGQTPNNYGTKEAAFEAAVAAASLALRQGHEVMIAAPGSGTTGTATGAGEASEAGANALVDERAPRSVDGGFLG
jgi:hypothetical protein